ncbi:hypothetical protein Tther_00615 [Tepidimonas thermarum]|uniref:Uncharacterized protein n=1 Tax=Tepidimonas thermarum TaxID=335431 RepID=A0A554X662_9BURK|nr:DUF1178 family protein [Tepidimonas thermarum]TSE31325.1 hypothetical protein Tther_00615 [Tepidimonas thermarum]
MKVLDLGCAQGHVFEGWFASEDDYQAQRERGLLTCPVCGEQRVEKRLSAPHVQTRRADPPRELAPPSPDAPDGAPQQARWLQALRALVHNSEDVGERFAAEARAIHEGRAPQRSIRGVATPDEAVALLEEGVAVVPLPDWPALKEPLQ